MPPDVISGRDIELIVVGVLFLLAGGTWVFSAEGSLDLVPPGLFVFVAALSFWLAWWDMRSRADL